MTKKIIKMDRMDYLQNLLPELPSNCIFNKGITGCGGSYLELHCKRNSVILVPTIELVKNKTENKIQPVYGKIHDKEIVDYLNSNVPYKKLIGTYDSLPRLLGLINPKNFFLLIDEYHLLFNSYTFRDEAIKHILNHYQDFNAFCFMSATPLDDLCILKELEHLDQVTLEWSQAIPVKINIVDTRYTSNELLNLFEKDNDCNWHIFLNSVSTIRQIVTKLNTDDYKVVCSQINRQRAQVKLNYGSTKDKPKKYNFYTSCSFEGCDIYDKIGRTVIMCDTNIATTILDISTLVRQICGRLRDSMYKDRATLILNTAKHRYANVSQEEFAEFVQNNINDGKLCEKQFQDFDERYKKLELRKYSPETYNSFYANRYENEIFYDDNLRKMDEYNYKLVREIYLNAITVMAECASAGFDTYREVKTGERWVRENLIKKEYTFQELLDIFVPIFDQVGLEFNHKTGLNEYFPSYTKRRRMINGIKETVYRFDI